LNKDMKRLRLTADKREIKDFPKLPSATSFIREPLGEILPIRKWRNKSDQSFDRNI